MMMLIGFIYVLIICYYIYTLKNRGIFNTIKLMNLVVLKNNKEENIKQISFISYVGLTKINLTPLLTKLNNTYIIGEDYKIEKLREIRKIPNVNVVYCFTSFEETIQNILEEFFEVKIYNLKIVDEEVTNLATN